MTSRPSPEPAQVVTAPTCGPVLGTRILQSEAFADVQYVIAALLPPRDAAALSFPSREPTPKAHVLLYHMAAQMGLLGGVGLLHEGIVEAAHVRDNEYRQRFVSVIDQCENLRLRFNAYQLSYRTSAV